MFVFSQIHEIVFHGNGGYDWETIYNMPLWLRRFTYEKIKEHFEKQKEEAEKAKNQSTNTNKSEITRPNIKSDYSLKAPKK